MDAIIATAWNLLFDALYAGAGGNKPQTLGACCSWYKEAILMSTKSNTQQQPPKLLRLRSMMNAGTELW